MLRAACNLLIAAYSLGALSACSRPDCPSYLLTKGDDCVALGDAGATKTGAQNEAGQLDSPSRSASSDAEGSSKRDNGTGGNHSEDPAPDAMTGGAGGSTSGPQITGSAGRPTINPAQSTPMASAGHGGDGGAESDASVTMPGAVCGNGIREGTELCDGADCKRECKSDNTCMLSQLEGSAETCDAHCVTTDIVQCAMGDGCCPLGCSYATDSDCSPSCGDGVITGNEKCEPNSSDHPCPTVKDCDDGDVCTQDKLSGSASQCSAECAHSAITRMPITCDDNDPCTDDMTVESKTACTFECVSSSPHKPTGSCADNDPCTDDAPVMSSTRCEYLCPHKKQQRSGPASCDDDDPCTSDERVESATTCSFDCKHNRQTRTGPSSCDDSNPCTTDGRMESDSACSFVCRHTPNEGQSCSGPFQGMKCNSKGQCELPALGLCGNGFLDEGESCDNTSMQDCPSCNDTNPCTIDAFSGSPETCNMVCSHMTIPGC